MFHAKTTCLGPFPNGDKKRDFVSHDRVQPTHRNRFDLNSPEYTHYYIPVCLVVRSCAFHPQVPGSIPDRRSILSEIKRTKKKQKITEKQGRAKPRKRLKRSIAYMWFFKFIYNVFISLLFLSSLSLLIFNFKCFSLNCCSALLLGHEQNASAGTSEA